MVLYCTPELGDRGSAHLQVDTPLAIRSSREVVRFASKCLQLSTLRSYDCTAPPSNDEGAGVTASAGSRRGILRTGEGRLAGQKAQRRWRWWWPTPSEQDQQAHLSNDVLAHWFLWSAFRRGAHKQKPRHRGAGLGGSILCLAIPGSRGPSEAQQAHHPNAQPLRWLMVAAETTAGHRKSPARRRG